MTFLALTPPWTKRRILLVASGTGLAAAAAASWRSLEMDPAAFIAGIADVRNLMDRMGCATKK